MLQVAICPFSELFFQPSLLQYAVGSVTRRNADINRKMLVRVRAVPSVKITFAMTNKVTIILLQMLQQFSFQIAQAYTSLIVRKDYIALIGCLSSIHSAFEHCPQSPSPELAAH
jgi:hypothetical protein